MKKALLYFFVYAIAVITVWGQERILTGKVSASDDGSSLPGVNVVLKGTTNGTVTDINGSYRLSIPAEGGTLVFSFIGLQTQEIAIGERSTVDVSLASDVQQLSEVVITGTGVATDKRKLGIAVESVTADKLPPAPTASIDQALIGKIPGAQISSTSGNPGDPINILLRGINTVQGGTKPLIMVDGVQIAATDINSLDLSNIERVEVVQGAASAALYGAQGANGAIQVFTKRGKRGPVSINISSSFAQNEFINSGNVNKAERHPYYTDANNNIISASGTIIKYDQYGSISGLTYEYGGTQLGTPFPSPQGGGTRYAVLDPRNVADKEYNANLKFYDHFDQIFQKGQTWNNNITVSGASDHSDYAIAVSRNSTLTPVMQNGTYERTNITANIGATLFKGFTLRSITQLVYTHNDIDPGLGGGGGLGFGKGNFQGTTGSVWSFLNTSPFFDLTATLADGTPPAYQYAGFVSVNAFNPYYVAHYSSSDDQKIDVLQNFNANYKINKFIELDAKYGINHRNQNVRWIFPNQSQNVNSEYYGAWAGWAAPDNTGEINDWNYKSTFQNFLGSAFVYLDFAKDFGMSLPIEASTQISFDYRQRDYKEYDTYGLGLPLVPPINMTSTGSQFVAYDYIEKLVTYGYLINQKINFGDLAGVTAGFRSDYSSAFGGGSKPFTFPHYDGFVAPSAFEFWQGIKETVPFFKLRAAYGAAGIQPNWDDRYPILNQRNLGNSLIYNFNQSNKNPDLSVEVSKEIEIGTDFTIALNKNGNLFKDLTFNFTYWSRKSENVIYIVSTPLSTGYTGALTNAIDMSSHGVQFALSMPIVDAPDFSWDFTTNFGKQTSMIDAIAGGANIILTSTAGSTALTLTPGQKIGQIYGFKTLKSIDQKREDGTPYIAPANASNYEVVNGHVVEKASKAIQWGEKAESFGDPNPLFNASFINNLTYKNYLTFAFQFDWVYRSHIYNQLREWMYRDGIHRDYAEPITVSGESAAWTAYYQSVYSGSDGSSFGPGNNATKDYFYEDASFIRLRNISLGFDIDRMIDIRYFKKLQLVLTGRNILTFTKYQGMDPEISSAYTANSAYDRGVENGTLPNIKSYQVGLNIGF